MPLLPFDLFNDETRLIMHDECLYKLKLSYKSEISLKKISSHQRDETNTELIKVIRAILFLINAEKDIPRKISTPCFMACVAVKFWKITLKLGFSKNGTRLKSGHIIDLTIHMKQNRIQRKEFSVANIWADTEPYSEIDHQAKQVQQFGHLGLRQFVINSDDSSSSSDIIPCYEPSLHSKSAENQCNNNISTAIDGPTENFENFQSLDPQDGQAKPPDQPVTNGHKSVSEDLDRSTDDSSESATSPDLPHGQAKPSDPSSDTILDEVSQMVSVSTSNKLVKQPPLSHPSEEINASLPIEATFISSCTQTDTDELDFYTKKPDPNTNDSEETFSQIHSDHNYFKNKPGNSISNSKEQPPQLQENETSNPDGSSVIDMPSSFSESIDDEENRRSVDDEDVRHSSSSEDVSSQQETHVEENLEILNAEPEFAHIGSLITNPNTKDNDIWGIENKQHEVVSEVEISIESRSESSQNTTTDSSKNCSEITSDQCSKKYPERDETAEQASKDEDSSNTERNDSAPAELKNNESVKTRTRREMGLREIIRIKRLKSRDTPDCISPPKVKKEKNPKKTSKGQPSTFCVKMISAKRKRNKSILQDKTFISGMNKTLIKRRQTKATQKNQASIFRKWIPQTREQHKRSRSRSKDVIHKGKRSPKSWIPKDQKKNTIGSHERTQVDKKTPPDEEQHKKRRSQSKDNIRMEKKSLKSGIPKDQRKNTIGSQDKFQVHKKTPPIREQRKPGRPRSKDVTPKQKTNLKIRLTDEKETTIKLNNRSQIGKKTPSTGEPRKRGRPKSRDVTPKKIRNPKNRALEDQKEIMVDSNDRSKVLKKLPPTGEQRKRGRPKSRDVTPKKIRNPKNWTLDQKEIMVNSNDRSEVLKKTPPTGKERKRGRPKSRDVTPKKIRNPKNMTLEDQKEITVDSNDRSEVLRKTPPTGKERKRGRPKSRDVTPKKIRNPKNMTLEDQKEIMVDSNDRSEVLKKTPPTRKERKSGRPRSRDVSPKLKTNPKSETPDDEKEKIVLHKRSPVHEKTPQKTPGKQCVRASPRSKDVTPKEKTNSKSGIPEDQISFGLHDRFQVQTQELQEDLKLQNLAHPNSTSPKKRRSLMQRIFF